MREKAVGSFTTLSGSFVPGLPEAGTLFCSFSPHMSSSSSMCFFFSTRQPHDHYSYL